MGYRFVGRPGDYLVGLPARDLSDDEVASLTPEQRNMLAEHLKSENPIYKEIVRKSTKASKPSAGEPVEPESVEEPARG